MKIRVLILDVATQYMGQIPHDGENGQNVAFFIFLKLCCDQMVIFFSTFVNCSEEILSVGC